MSATDEGFGQRASTYTMPLNKDDQPPPINAMSKGVLPSNVAISTPQERSQDLGAAAMSNPASVDKLKVGQNSLSQKSDIGKKLAHIIAMPDVNNQTEAKRAQQSTQYDGIRTPSPDAYEKVGAILDKSEENKSNDGVFKAIYSS